MSSSGIASSGQHETIEAKIDNTEQGRAQLDERLVLVYNNNCNSDSNNESSFDIDYDLTPTAENQTFHYDRSTIEIRPIIETTATDGHQYISTSNNTSSGNNSLADTYLINKNKSDNNSLTEDDLFTTVVAVGSPRDSTKSTNYININSTRTVIADAITRPTTKSSVDVTKIVFNDNNKDSDDLVPEVHEEPCTLMNLPDAMFELNDLHATSTSNGGIGHHHHQHHHGKHLNYYGSDLSSAYSFHPTLYADSITFGGDSSCYSTPCAVSASQDLMMHGYEPALGAGPPLMSASSPSSSALSTGTGRTLATLCASAPTSLTPIEQYHSSSASSSFVDHCFAASASSLDSCHNGSLMTLDTYINDNSCQQYYQQPQYYHLQPQQLQQQQQHLHSVGRSSTSCINSCQDLLNASFTSQLSTASTNSTLLDPGTLSSHMPTKMTMLQSAAVTRSANQFSVSASSSASSASTATTTSTASAASTVEQQHLDHHSSFNRSDGGSSIQSDCTHTNEADYHPYTCQWFDCYLSFIDMHEFVKHLEEVHVNSTSESKHKYYCAWQNCRRADQPFNARYKLLIHMRVHSGEKPYPCEQDSCRKSFSRLENLKIHNRSHTGEKPYSCKYDGCNKAFTNSSDRIKHHKTHVDAKPYACAHTNCTKRYTDPSSLRKHLKVHRAKANNANNSNGSNKGHADDNLLKSSQDSLRESDQDQVLSYSWTGESFVKRIYGNNNNAYHNKNNWTTATVDNRDDDSNLSDIYDYNNNHSRLASSFTSGCAPMFNANSNNHHRRASMFELPSVSLQNNHSLFVVPPSTDIMNSTNSVHQDGLQVDTLL